MELYGSLFNISGSVTASTFTGSFIGDGSGLFGIQASGVTGLNLSQIASGDATASITTAGFTVNKNTQIQGNLSVSGALIANEYIVSSSVIYMTTSFASGSSAFGDDLMDTHKFTGSVQITGSISLNGQAIGTGKLDETTFQSYTSSNNSRVTALETSSGSLNSFTSSINTTIKSKLDNDNVISSSVQVVLTGTTGYSTFSSSLATTTSGLTSTITSLSSSLTSSIGSLSSSIATTDLNQENRLNALETSSGSLNSFTSSINTTIKSKLDTESVISGSAQVNITGTTGYSTFSSSISNSINNLSGSVATTTSGITSTITMLSSSLTSSFGELSSSVATTTLNLKNRVDSIETSTGSLNSFTGSINTTIKSKLDTENVISGSVQVNITGTTGYSTFSSSISTSIGSLSSSVATTTNDLSSSLTSSIGSLSSSVATTTSGLTSTITSLSSSIATTTSGLTSTITSLSSSVSITTSGLTSTISSLSSSIATTTLNQSGRLTSIEGKTGSYATTGSNIFQGNQTITGSLYISQDLIVAGSSSIQHISSSVVNIADNIITVNAQNPAVRFGGLAVIDSGSSPQVSGSLLFDATENEWIFVHQNQSAVTSALLIMGPETYNDIGNEIHLTNNRLVKSTTDEHIGDSNITDTGTKVSVNSNTEITGSLIVAGGNKLTVNAAGGDEGGEILLSKAITNTTLAGEGVTIDVWQNRLRFFEQGGNARGAYLDISSLANGVGTNLLGTAATASYIEYSNVANKPTLVSGSSQISFLSVSNIPSGLVSGSSQVLAGTTIHSGAFFNGISVVSGSAQISFGGITGVPAGLVSGSSQITFGSISSIPSGLVSGSSQITLSSTTGFGTYLNQAVLTTSTPTFSTVSATTFTGALSGNATTASSISGFNNPTTSATANTIAYRDASGDIYARYFLGGYVNTTDNIDTGTITYIMAKFGDNYHRSATAAKVQSFLGLGSAAYQNTSAFLSSSGSVTVGGYLTVTGAGTSSSIYMSDSDEGQREIHCNSNRIGFLTQAGAWGAYCDDSGNWAAANFSGSSSGTNTGDQTSVSGNAGTVTNGVYTVGNQSIGGQKTFTGGAGAITITSSDIRSNASSDWTGDPGAQGKIQYHSNRWYIVADSSSDRIVQFRRNATDVSHIDNSGVYQGSISGNAATAGGFTPSQTSGTANRIVVADANGYIVNNYFNASGGGSERNASGMGYFAGHNTSDYYYRSYTAAAAAALLSGQAMNISGNATTASSTGTLSSNAVTNGYLVIGGNYSNNAYNGVAGGTRLMFGGGNSDAVDNYYIGTNMEDVGGNYNKLDIRWHTGIRMGAQQGYGGIRFYNNEDLSSVLFSIGNSDGNVRSHTNLLPSANNSYNLGSASLRWANLYTNDLHLSNEGKEGGNEIDGTTGNWTIQEGNENLYIINNKNGKKFKIDLTEII
jgi:hypothetical protein